MGMPYIELEHAGIVMPVFSVESKYRNVIKYDELITIETTVEKVPAVRMEFFTRIYNEDGKLAHEAKVVLVFMDMKTGRPVRAPEQLVKLLENYYG
jgi:acyl-CoA thioester hydrolase